jgi:hypothetical protein
LLAKMTCRTDSMMDRRSSGSSARYSATVAARLCMMDVSYSKAIGNLADQDLRQFAQRWVVETR